MLSIGARPTARSTSGPLSVAQTREIAVVKDMVLKDAAARTGVPQRSPSRARPDAAIRAIASGSRYRDPLETLSTIPIACAIADTARRRRSRSRQRVTHNGYDGDLQKMKTLNQWRPS